MAYILQHWFPSRYALIDLNSRPTKHSWVPFTSHDNLFRESRLVIFRGSFVLSYMHGILIIRLHKTTQNVLETEILLINCYQELFSQLMVMKNTKAETDTTRVGYFLAK